jgi:hypothetical protein
MTIPRDISHEDYLEGCRKELVSTAKAILIGELGIIAGSRKLWRLSNELGYEGDADLGHL